MKIFISYRRAEDNKSYIVGTIHEKLAKVFGEKDIFRDIYDIPGGAEWRDVLNHEINSCKVMLVVIGPDWANLSSPNGEKRLFDPTDVTRWEVETGLRRSTEENVTVIPVLVIDAKLPTTAELPESLRPLLGKNVRKIRNFPDFDSDMEKLIGDIRHSRGYAEEDISIASFEPKTIYIAEGPFLMGHLIMEGVPTHETPQHEVSLPAFRIGKYPVKNSQYEEFIRQTRRIVSPSMGWDGQRVPKGLQDHPVTGVTWFEALAYCQWLMEKTGRKYSLPNEAQWEKTCRGGNNFVYPWGNEFDPQRCNCGRPTLTAVDAYPAQNDYGCFDFVGNALQWTCSLWGEKRIAPDPEYLYPWKEDARNDPNANSQIRRVLRGSSFKAEAKFLRCSARSGQPPAEAGLPGARHGFRVAIIIE
jgi:formylglycine-generating enzyme required for sulfatase activity